MSFTTSVLLSLGAQFAAAAAIPTQLEASVPAASCSTDVRVNQFTGSRQDGVSLALQPDGTSVVVWHSRRQEGGTYGVRARRVTSNGRAIGDEVQVNETTRGMQLLPSTASDAAGAVWFAWVSRGQDGDGDGVYARRFAPDLSAATGEVQVDDVVAGDQSEPSIVALGDGRAVCVWTGPADDRVGAAVYARFLAASGEPVGDRLRLDAGVACGGVRTPAAVATPTGVAVVFGTHDAAGVPTAIVLREVRADGAVAAPVTVMDASAGAPVEPVLAATAERIAVAWLAARADGDHAIRWRDWAPDGCASPSPAATKDGTSTRLGIPHEVVAPGAGYTSGLAIDARGPRTAVAFGRHLHAEQGTPDLFVAVVDDSAAAAARVATGWRTGEQSIDIGGSGRRLLFLPGGSLALAWQGDAGMGDDSGAHLSRIELPGAEDRVAAGEGPAPAVQRADALVPLKSPAIRGTRAAATAAGRAGGAAPHDPPFFDKRNAESNAPVAAPDGAGGDIDFLGFNSTGWTPPDPEMAVGMDHLVVIVNGGIKFFDKSGTQLFFDQIEGSSGFWGSVGATSFVFDPEVIWDPHTNRFVALAGERSGAASYFLLAVSDDANPVGTWFKYRIDVSAIMGRDIDSINLSVDDEALYLTGDWFGPNRYLIHAVDKTSVLSGGTTPIARSVIISGRHSLGAPVHYDAGAPAAYFVHAPESAASSQIRVYAVTDPLGAPSTQFVDVPVPTYTRPADPPQMGTSNRPELFEARFWSAVVRNGRLWATHHQGTPVRQRWYEVDLRGWPTSGQPPTLVQSGQVESPSGGATFFGSLWVNALGQMALTCATSSPTEFISMAHTSRTALDPPGFTAPLTTIRTSTSPETSGRWGDYSATNDDPADVGRFWGHHEYRDSSWRTRVASFGACNGDVLSYCTTSPNSVGSGALITASGSASLAANDLVLHSQGASSGAFGVFFFGDARASTSVGDGTLCVSGSLFRLGVTQADIFGLSSLALDTSTFPASTIAPGSTWNFQYFYRDIQPGGSGLNFSDAVEVRFCD